MTRAETIRSVTMALLGVAGLVFKSAYNGPSQEIVSAQGGNFAVSFAVYFVAVTAASRLGFGRIAAATATLLAVEAFEATNGFGVMTNTYDRLDFVANALGVGVAVVANALGVGVAVVADLVSSQFLNRLRN